MNGFTVGVTIQMIDRFSAGLKSISSGVLTASVGADKLKDKLKGVHQKIVAVQALQSVGQNMLKMSENFFAPAIKQGDEYIRVLNQMKMQGLSVAEVNKNISASWNLSDKLITTTPTENLKSLLELKNFFVNSKMEMPEARELLPDFMKAKTILAAASEHMHFDSGGQTYAMAKALEMRGAANHPAQFQEEIEAMTKTMVASSGKVLPSDYQMVMKYARIGKIGFDKEFLYNKLPEIIMENKTSGGGGANSVGTQLQALLRMGIQGVMNVPTATNLQKLGLLPHAVMKTTTTGTAIKEKGSVAHADLLARDPYEWVNTILIPAMEKQQGHKFKDAKELNTAINTTLKGAGTMTGIVSELANKAQQIKRFEMVMKNLKNTNLLVEMAKNDPSVAYKAFNASMEKLYTAFGEHVVPLLVPRIMQLAETIGQAAKWLHENPDAAKWIMYFVAGIGVVGGILAAIATVVIPGLVLSAMGVAAPFWAAAAAIYAAVHVATLGVAAIMNWSRVSREFQRILNQGESVFIAVGVAFRSMLSMMLSGIASFVAGASANIAKMSGGLINFDTGGLTKFAADFRNNTIQQNAADIARINELKKAGANPVVPPKQQSSPVIQNHTAIHATITVDGSQDPKAVGRAVKEALNDMGRQAARKQTVAGGVYNSPHHAGGR